MSIRFKDARTASLRKAKTETINPAVLAHLEAAFYYAALEAFRREA